MPTLIFGALALVLVLWALSVISKVDPRVAARVTKIAGGLLALGFGVFLGLRGEIGIAIPLGAFGLGLLGWVPFGPAGFSARTQKSEGQTSRVRSTFFELELDHDTGAMRGRVLAGRHQGAELESFDVKTLAAMLSDVDEESGALLVAYLDRREPGWSEHAQADAAAGRRASSSGKMSEQEAYQILGLEAGASANEISRAHRTGVMVEFHLEIGRAHTRRLSRTLLRTRRKAGRSERHPAEQPKPKCAKRNGNSDLAAQSQKYGKTERQQPAADLRHAGGDFRISFGNDIERP